MNTMDQAFASHGLDQVIARVAGHLDETDITPTERKKLELDLHAALAQRDAEIEGRLREVIGARERVLTAELAQGDDYTKRARPSVVYAGLLFIFLVHVVLPFVALIKGDTTLLTDPLGNPVVSLPTDFWLAWGGVVATYAIGRSFEKMGASNRVTRLITGNEKVKLIDNPADEAKG